MRRRKYAIAAFVATIAIALIVWFAIGREWSPSTGWHDETGVSERLSFLGSYDNGRKTLKVKSHAWKFIQLRGYSDCEWGFKVVVNYPEDPSDNLDEWGRFKLFMPITKLEYKLFDEDGFQLATLEMDESKFESNKSSMGVGEGGTETFQTTGIMSVVDARRVAYGKLNIQAGYVPTPSK